VTAFGEILNAIQHVKNSFLGVEINRCSGNRSFPQMFWQNLIFKHKICKTIIINLTNISREYVRPFFFLFSDSFVLKLFDINRIPSIISMYEDN